MEGNGLESQEEIAEDQEVRVQYQLLEGRVCDLRAFVFLGPCRVTGTQGVFIGQKKKWKHVSLTKHNLNRTWESEK